MSYLVFKEKNKSLGIFAEFLDTLQKIPAIAVPSAAAQLLFYFRSNWKEWRHFIKSLETLLEASW